MQSPRRNPRSALALALVLVAAAVLAGCGDGDVDTGSEGTVPPETAAPAPQEPAEADEPAAAAEAPAEALPEGVMPRPDWLGTRLLPVGPQGFGEIQPTPPELVDRRLPPPPGPLEPPPDETFVATIDEVPDDVAARSTWDAACPVGLDDLRYVTVSFWGFDERFHTGELLVNAAVAEPVVGVFRRLHEARFPIEEMRITTREELDAHPTGDGNNAGAFVCRPSRGTTSWSDHAYGLAVDINPFHNPYVRGEVVLPELASAYADRSWDRPGMIQPGDVVVRAFAEIGWPWGGNWRSSKDYMHFSASGR